MSKVMFDQNSMFLELLGLSQATDDTFVITATVSADIMDEDATSVWSGSLSYLGSAVTRGGITYTDGNYRATVPETVTWSTNADGSFQRHWAEITADDGASRDGFWREFIKVETRNFGD
jgi:hypothetical protein